MSRSNLIDTGPLVALLDRRDEHHAWADKTISEALSPLFTCEAVISEACFLLKRLKDGPRKVLQMIRKGALVLSFRAEAEIAALDNLMAKYANVPMSFADACLVRMTELYSGSKLFTIDSDFLIYRKNMHEKIPVLMPGK